VTTPLGLYPQVQIEKNGSPGIYPHGVITCTIYYNCDGTAQEEMEMLQSLWIALFEEIKLKKKRRKKRKRFVGKW
jgi:hypothetical protein